MVIIKTRHWSILYRTFIWNTYIIYRYMHYSDTKDSIFFFTIDMRNWWNVSRKDTKGKKKTKLFFDWNCWDKLLTKTPQFCGARAGKGGISDRTDTELDSRGLKENHRLTEVGRDTSGSIQPNPSSSRDIQIHLKYMHMQSYCFYTVLAKEISFKLRIALVAFISTVKIGLPTLHVTLY